MIVRLAMATALLIGISAGCTERNGEISARGLWARPTVVHEQGTVGVVTSAAIYGTLSNATGRDDRIVGVSVSPAVARRAEIHETRREGNSVRMREVDVLDLPDGDEATFAPGGLHVMLTGLARPLREGDGFDVTFRFARAGEVMFSVRVSENAP